MYADLCTVADPHSRDAIKGDCADLDDSNDTLGDRYALLELINPKACRSRFTFPLCQVCLTGERTDLAHPTHLVQKPVLLEIGVF